MLSKNNLQKHENKNIQQKNFDIDSDFHHNWKMKIDQNIEINVDFSIDDIAEIFVLFSNRMFSHQISFNDINDFDIEISDTNSACFEKYVSMIHDKISDDKFFSKFRQQKISNFVLTLNLWCDKKKSNDKRILIFWMFYSCWMIFKFRNCSIDYLHCTIDVADKYHCLLFNVQTFRCNVKNSSLMSRNRNRKKCIFWTREFSSTWFCHLILKQIFISI